MMNPSISDDFISANTNTGEISVGTVKIYTAIPPGEVKNPFGSSSPKQAVISHGNGFT